MDQLPHRIATLAPGPSQQRHPAAHPRWHGHRKAVASPHGAGHTPCSPPVSSPGTLGGGAPPIERMWRSLGGPAKCGARPSLRTLRTRFGPYRPPAVFRTAPILGVPQGVRVALEVPKNSFSGAFAAPDRAGAWPHDTPSRCTPLCTPLCTHNSGGALVLGTPLRNLPLCTRTHAHTGRSTPGAPLAPLRRSDGNPTGGAVRYRFRCPEAKLHFRPFPRAPLTPLPAPDGGFFGMWAVDTGWAVAAGNIPLEYGLSSDALRLLCLRL